LPDHRSLAIATCSIPFSHLNDDLKRPIKQTNIQLKNTMKHTMKHIATLITAPIFLATGTSAIHASTASFGGDIYETVDWTSTDQGTNTAIGITSTNTVNFSTGSFAGGAPFITERPSDDYAFDPNFDALSYGPAPIESLDIFAISSGPTIITLSNSVDSALLLIGTANGFTSGLNSGKWEFTSEWSLSVLDSDQLTITGGNVIEGSGSGPGGTGVVRVSRLDGNLFNTFSFSHQSGGGGGNGDGLSLGVGVSQVPEPSSSLLLSFAGCALLARRKR
jgi:hypothetical protein